MYGFEIDRDMALSNAKQLENQLRDAILNGKLAAGTRLLPTRGMAKDLGIARNTVIQVYEQLTAEGYLESKEGSGTYVANIGKLPQSAGRSYEAETVRVKQQNPDSGEEDLISFNAGNPDVSAFPRIQWAKMLKEACLDEDDSLFACLDYAGHPELRRAISSYVYRMKGILCEEEQIIIIPGASGGMDILAKALKRKYNRIAIEDPCIDFVKCIFASVGYEIKPVAVDAHGMDISSLRQLDRMDLIYVVPSHQYPIGGVLPAARRISLLQYASEQQAYVIEDDYDSEFRYKGETLQALRNLDPERVIYLGSFSKIFSPILRLGYMILPKHLCNTVIRQMELSNLYVNPTIQLAMAEFINRKLLDKHIYKMKKLYEGKRIHLMECLRSTFGEHIKISGEYAGMHLLATFDREFGYKDIIAMFRNGVDIDLVEDYAVIKGGHRNQLVLGYGELSLARIEEGVHRLKAAIG